ncbi:hypothetical protein [Nonomuraea sp. 10N515B]|uniref:hypothetical protein n=1 Tax=Nonomuraea sp. 10N515B TaxID=3457422 RepID=UPI003FCE8ABC
MLLDWIRTKRTLIAERDDARAYAAELDLELEDLTGQNEALHRQLNAARVEANVLKDENAKLDGELVEVARARNQARQELAERGALTANDEKTTTALGEQREPRSLQARLLLEKARADALAQRLDELTQKSMAADRR